MGKYGLLGAHLEYSYSPEIHSKFGDYQYDLIEIPEEKLKEVVNSPEYDGFNVTIPYKRSVITLCDEVSSEALRIGAVNTIVKENGLKKGYNTDYFGFCYMLKRNNIELKGKKCMVLGNGGASAMVQTVMRDQGASEIVVVSRHGEDNYDNLDRHFDSEIIVNATPVGMYPNNGVSLVNVDDFPNLSGAVDLIYNPNKTKFILDATTRGIPACGGLSMLVAQAEKSSELFQHRVIDDEEIDAAIYDIRSELLNVVLIGMPGAGKTFLGRRIAEREHRKFIDLDDLIVEREGMSIPEIFRTKGEDYFRNVETEVLRETCKMSGVVIACGGGIVKRKQNYNLAKQNSRIIWVKRDLDKLDTEGRPISQTKSVEEIYEARKDLYEAWSDYFIDNNQDFN
ncbi:shikimate kinase [Eubacterium pyruvativorans]|uniref:Shikimate kinase n=1 Tax=Eubacterium pyruvativorans TaxID=155865 RepID=A0A1I7GHM5_9FIRM|nr:shikimate kinase [Eubacterium pyruvativorans]MCI5747661.1 shikimate kinase [Eubacterium pyruvativorans]MDD6708437.1 shikimate kinase [Eubacterium pyruvativorans]MDD7684631.1 shikimate kinase [Eubacterium pyruvativorans]MDY4049797.1 shikimate kinase [Eubacterium pyruvativorans]SDE66190.1 shikimate kinase [Eubacterium pyruvativorans]